MRFISNLFISSASTACAAGLALAMVAAVPQASAAAATRLEAQPETSELRIVKQVAPDYPAHARAFRVQGVVTLQALVGRDGKIRQVKILDGRPALTEAAARAVRKWEYAPFVVDSRAFEVPTRVVVNFSIASE